MTSDQEQDWLRFDPFEGDISDSDKLSDKIVTCRKAGACSHCGGPLVPGTRVRRMAEKVDGALMSHSWCNECCQAMIEEVEPDDADDDWLPAWEVRCGLHNGSSVARLNDYRDGDPSEGGKP